MAVNKLVRELIFSRRLFIRMVFGVKVIAPPSAQSYCEWGSIMLRRRLKRYVAPEARVLEVGAGAHALLAIFVSKRFPRTTVVATDIVPERVSLARQTVAANAADVECLTADMFEGVEGEFDLIFFNPPAIPTGELAEFGYELVTHPDIGERRCWSSDGGADGLDLIRGFLGEVADHLTPNGLALIAANPSHCPPEWFAERCPQVGLEIQRVHRLRGINNVYVLKPVSPGRGEEASPPSARGS